MNLILSIKPVYVNKIFQHVKGFEYRKSIFRRDNINLVYIYATAPTKKIVGSFKIGKIINDSVNKLWKLTREQSGLSYDDFFRYFNGHKTGYAIEIRELKEFKTPVNPKDIIENFVAPQSFCYIDIEFMSLAFGSKQTKKATAKPATLVKEQLLLTRPKQDSKLLNIGYVKSCNCPTNHMNCLTPKEWIRSMVGIWEFNYEKRDIRDKNVHPAVFPIALPAKCIKLFTHEGELVIDPFVGIGSTLVAAKDLNRNAIGFDLKQEYIDVAKERLAQTDYINTTQQIPIKDDARNISKYIRENTVSLTVTSPPYSKFLAKPKLNKSRRGDLRNKKYYLDIQQYSEDPNDLCTLEPITFSKAIAEIYRDILPLLKPKAHCVININDLWWENKRIPTHVYVIQELLKVGYELRNILIWDRRNLVNRPGIFGWPSNFIKLGTTFEYILDFWKPPQRKMD